MAFETTYKPYIPVSAQKDFEELLTKWNNAEKAQAIAVLKKSMSEQAETKKVETTVVQSYIEQTIKAGMQNDTLPNYPEDFSVAAKSTYYKEVIREVVQELDVELNLSSIGNAAAKAVWNEVKKAKTIIEFKKFFKIYLISLQEDTVSVDDVQWYTDRIEELEKEVQKLNYYKQAYSGIFDVVLEDKNDQSNKYLAKKVSEEQDKQTMTEVLKLKSIGFKETEALKALGITKDRLNYVKKKVGTAFIDSMQKLIDKQKKDQEKVKDTVVYYEYHKQAHNTALKQNQQGKNQTDEEFFASFHGIDTTLDGI